MVKEKVKIGVVPMHRDFLSMEEAVRQKIAFTRVIDGIRPDAVELVYIDDLCENGILSRNELVDRVVEKMKRSGVHALFLPFCDFGEEVVAARVTAALKLPVLVWGARDERPNSDLSRGRDTQCGIFAATKSMARMGVRYSYIQNAPVESEIFRKGFEKFIRVVSVVRSLTGLKIAQIGQRPASFMSVAANEASLAEKFGIEVVPLGVNSVLKRMENIKANDPQRVEMCLAGLKEKVETSRMTEERLFSMALFKLALQDLIPTLGCRGAALECWSAFPAVLGITPCFMIGELIDEGIPISCETDLNGAVTAVMLQAATLGDSATFFADLTIRHPENDNAELLWHCGPFPYSLREPGCAPFLVDGRGRFPLKRGEVTLARFDSIRNHYSLVALEGRGVDGPATTGTYLYFETENWPRVEEKFVFGPYVHHVVGAYGNYSTILKEAARLIDHLHWDDVKEGPESL